MRAKTGSPSCVLFFNQNDELYRKQMKNYINVITIIIAINLLVYFVSQSIIGYRLDPLTLYFPEHEQAGTWQFVTHMFMHGGIFHLLMNMFGLWMFGTPLAQRWGKKRFLIFYFTAGIGAAIIYTGVNYYQFDVIYNQLTNAGLSADKIQSMLDKSVYPPSIITEEQFIEFYQIMNSRTVGASGAIYGILVAFGVIFPNTKLMFIFLPFPIAAKYFIPALISLDLFLGLTGFSIFGSSISIAHFAHVGGALVGFLLVMYWHKIQRQSLP